MEQIKKRIKKAFERPPKYELVEMPYIDCAEDPVRPELDLAFRQAYGRKIFGLKDGEGDIAAVMCFAFTHDVPKTCLLYTSPSPRDYAASRMPSSA